MFVRSFGEGLHDPSSRVLETEWRAPLQAMIDTAFACAACSYEHAADWRGERLTAPMACLACGSVLGAPDGLKVGRRMIGLSLGRRVPGDALGLRGEGAVVETHPSRPDMIGLRNLGESPWQATVPGGQTHPVAAGQAVRLLPGLRIDFGKQTGAVYAAREEQTR